MVCIPRQLTRCQIKQDLERQSWHCFPLTFYGRARDICISIGHDIINSEDGVHEIVSTFHKSNILTVFCTIYAELMNLLNTKRSSRESFREFEPRFTAQKSKLNSFARQNTLSDALSALMLLFNANLDTNKCVSILAATTPSSVVVDYSDSKNWLPELVHYDSVPAIMRHCHKQSLTSNREHRQLSFHSVYVRFSLNRTRRIKHICDNCMTREQV